MNEVMRIYKEKWQFPMRASAIDGTHILIITPVVDHADCVNWKVITSLCKLLWTASIFSETLWSGLAASMKLKFFPTQLFSRREIKVPFLALTPYKGCDIQPLLLSDPAYPLRPWLVNGYPENSNTSDDEKHFNYMLSRARMTVENTFERWKGHFQKFLKKVDMPWYNTLH